MRGRRDTPRGRSGSPERRRFDVFREFDPAQALQSTRAGVARSVMVLLDKKRVVENFGERLKDGSFLLLLAAALVLVAAS